MDQGTASTPDRSSRTRLLGALAWPLVVIALIFYIDQQRHWLPLPKEQIHKGAVVGYILLGSLLLHRIACSIVLDSMASRYRSRPVPKILKHLIGVLIAMIALIFAANVVVAGSINNLLTLSGVIGVVLGIALKPLILDVFSGISTNLDSAFQIGDWIEIGERPDGSGGHQGWVVEINWRTTHIRTRTGNLIICPNSEVSTALITNFSRPWPLSRCDISVKIPPEIDPIRVHRLLQAAVNATIGMPDGPSAEKTPVIEIGDLDDSSATYFIRYWIDFSKQSYRTANHQIYTSVLRHLNIAGIPLAEPAVLNRDYREIPDPRSKTRRAEILAKIELFEGIDEDRLEELAAGVVSSQFHRDEVIVEEGSHGSDLFVIIEGGVEISVCPQGTKIIVARLGAGDYFGEMSLLTGEPRAATVTALTDCEVYQVTRDGMANLLSTDDSLMDLISRNAAERNLNRSIRMDAAQHQSTEERTRGLASNILHKMREIFGRRR